MAHLGSSHTTAAAMEDALILYPSPSMGHLIAMVEFGKLILHHHPSFSITILTLTPPFSTGSTADYIAAVSSAAPSLTFRHIHPISDHLSSQSVEETTFELVRLSNPNLHQIFQSLPKIKALILDFFSYTAMEIAEKLQIPTYYFNTSSATCLSSFLYTPTIHETTNGNLQDLETLLELPSLPPIRASDFFAPMLVRDTVVYKEFLNCVVHMKKSRGIIVNTFSSLESRALKSFSDGVFLAPTVFTVGPLISVKDEDLGEHECLRWLSTQPRKSVVFLCFGSLGLFSAEQLAAMAAGLEKSGRRFLWVVRTPPQEKNRSQTFYTPPEPDLDELLPSGFLERTKERGFVVKTWAPQVAVLNHDSVGGFVTHCGWNSVLEAVCAGVPMVAWPLYAEQRMNRVWLVEEIKLALAVTESEDGFVSADELVSRIDELMDSETGKRVRERILGLREEAMAALEEGGSSLKNLAELAELWKS